MSRYFCKGLRLRARFPRGPLSFPTRPLEFSCETLFCVSLLFREVMPQEVLILNFRTIRILATVKFSRGIFLLKMGFGSRWARNSAEGKSRWSSRREAPSGVCDGFRGRTRRVSAGGPTGCPRKVFA